MTGSVFRVVAARGFTTLQNETVNDRRLSPEALGVLIRLAGKPAAWDIQAANIEKENNIGKDKRRRIFSELEGAGYARRFRTQTVKGQWIQVTEVYVVSRKPAEGGFSGVGKSDAGGADAGNHAPIVKNTNKKTVNKKQPPPAKSGGLLEKNAAPLRWPPGISDVERELCAQMLIEHPRDLQLQFLLALTKTMAAGRLSKTPSCYIAGCIKKHSECKFSPQPSPARQETDAERSARLQREKRDALAREAAAHDCASRALEQQGRHAEAKHAAGAAQKARRQLEAVPTSAT